MPLGAALSIAVLMGTEPHPLAPYAAFAPGDVWTYEVRGSETTLEQRAHAAAFRGAPVVRRQETGGGFTLESFDPERGWLLHAVGRPDETTLELERPLVWLPPALEPGEQRQSLVRFVHRIGEDKRDVGSVTNEVTLVGFETIETPAGRFENCLVLDRSLVFMFYSGAEERSEGREWLAPGIGLVRSTGARDLTLLRTNQP